MEPWNFRNLWTRGTPYGCLAGIVLIAMLGFGLMIGFALGGAHCTPAPACQVENDRLFRPMMAVVLLGGALLALLVRWLIDRLPTLPPVANAMLIVGTVGLATCGLWPLLWRIPW